MRNQTVALLIGAVALLIGAVALVSAQDVKQKRSFERITPPGSLELTAVLHHDEALNRAHDVELQGNLAFVAGKGGSLAIIDVSDPRKPQLLSFLYDPKGLEEAETVLPMGDVLLLGARDLLAIDIRDSRRPKILKKIADRPRIDFINGMALRGNYLLAANKEGFIVLFDVSNPADPVYIGACNTKDNGGPLRPHDVAVRGDYVVVVDSAAGVTGRHANVFIYRIAAKDSHKLLPIEQWTLEGMVRNTPEQELAGANRVAVWNGHGAAGAFSTDLVGIFDLSIPTKPQIVATLPVCDLYANGMTISGRILFVAGGECAEAIDVSNPSSPVSVARYRGGSLFPTRQLMLDGRPRWDNGHDLVYRDGYLYVTAQNDNRLGILKILNEKILELAEPKDPIK